MSYTLGLTDTATFYQVSKSQNSNGEQIETESVRYDSINCKMNLARRSPVYAGNEGAQQNFISSYTLQVENTYNEAVKGDKVLINGAKFLIVEGLNLKGTTTAPKLVLYYLEKITDAT